MRSAAHSSTETQLDGGGAHLDEGQARHETQARTALVNTLPTATSQTDPKRRPPSADLPPGHPSTDTHVARAGGDLPADHACHDTQDRLVGGTHDDALLLTLADALDDLERARIATENRLRSLVQIKGLEDSRETRTMEHIAATLGDLEHRAELDLNRTMRAHPLGPWVKRHKGIGEKQGARLIAAIGDPYIKPPVFDEDGAIIEASRPRLVSELRQYCGHGAPSKRQRGVKSWWDPTAKMRVHLVAESVIQAGIRKTDGCDDSDGYDFRHRRALTPLAAAYLAARADWADRDTSDGHKHNHALRMVGKAILLDLWLAAREQHD